jgi:hypothetical protein
MTTPKLPFKQALDALGEGKYPATLNSHGPLAIAELPDVISALRDHLVGASDAIALLKEADHPRAAEMLRAIEILGNDEMGRILRAEGLEPTILVEGPEELQDEAESAEAEDATPVVGNVVTLFPTGGSAPESEALSLAENAPRVERILNPAYQARKDEIKNWFAADVSAGLVRVIEYLVGPDKRWHGAVLAATDLAYSEALFVSKAVERISHLLNPDPPLIEDDAVWGLRVRQKGREVAEYTHGLRVLGFVELLPSPDDNEPKCAKLIVEELVRGLTMLLDPPMWWGGAGYHRDEAVAEVVQLLVAIVTTNEVRLEMLGEAICATTTSGLMDKKCLHLAYGRYHTTGQILEPFEPMHRFIRQGPYSEIRRLVLAALSPVARDCIVERYTAVLACKEELAKLDLDPEHPVSVNVHREFIAAELAVIAGRPVDDIEYYLECGLWRDSLAQAV